MSFSFSSIEIRSEMWRSSNKIIWGSVLLLLTLSILDFLLLKHHLELVILNIIVIGLILISHFSFINILKKPIILLHIAFTMHSFLSLYSLSITDTTGNVLYMSYIVVVFVFFNTVAVWRIFDAALQFILFCALVVLMGYLRLFEVEDMMMSGGYLTLSVCAISVLFTYVRYLTIKDQVQDSVNKELNIKESQKIAHDLEKELRNKKMLIKDIENLAKVFRHNIKNKLGGAVSLIDIIEKEGLYTNPKGEDNYLQLIKRSIADSLNESEDFMRNLDNNSFKQEMNIEKTEISVHDVVKKEKLKFFEKTIPRNINFEIEFAAKNDMIQVDENLFSVAIYNILKYSVEFSANNDTISITTSNTKNFFILEVVNRETGMSMLKLDAYFNDISDFEPRKIGQSEGLGLSIAQNNIEVLGGQMRYSSSNSLGFEFMVEFQFDN